MKTQRLSIIMNLILFSTIFASCTNDMLELENEKTLPLKQIVMITQDFQPEADSRTLYEITDKVKCTWAANDTVGVFPNKGAQAYFPMISEAGVNKAVFDGEGWALKDDCTYTAYYPFIGDIYLNRNAIPVSYTDQTQTGNGSINHLGAYDYMVAQPTAPQHGCTEFIFKHLSAMVQLRLTVPEPTIISSVSLVTDTEAFTIKGKVDIMASIPSITPVTPAQEVKLDLKDIATTEENQVITLYMMIPPTDLSKQSLKAVAITKEGVQEITFEGKNFEAGKMYVLSATLNSEPIESMSILSYLIANNNLDSDLLANIGGMYDGLAAMTEPATLLVYWDGRTTIGPNQSNHLILKYQTDGKGNINGIPALDNSASLYDILNAGIIIKEYTTQLSTDKDVMRMILKDMASQTHSEKLGLIVGSHGSSWLNSIYTSRAFGQDGSGDQTMLIPDMVEAISATNKKYEFILFDTCYMGTAEVAHAFRNVCNYQLSSVMEVTAYGFPYKDFMKHLYKGNVENYKQVCQTYIDFYKNLYTEGSYAWGTISLIDSKEMDNLASELKKEIVAHKDILANYETDHLQEYGRSSGPYIACDLGHMISDLNGGTMPSAFSTQLAKTILYKDCLENARPVSYGVDATHFSGLGIYIPVSARPNWNLYFKTLDWYTVSGWNEVSFNWDF